ncbi:hypothetical protein HK105_204189 [Polyrhizophydium stewartii]|uniref:Uncharacterized protein n=1 Tax=Polyrhizophydium stewartii TaxID=2732419 RepID=A0ABR4N997_9FUNG
MPLRRAGGAARLKDAPEASTAAAAPGRRRMFSLANAGRPRTPQGSVGMLAFGAVTAARQTMSPMTLTPTPPFSTPPFGTGPQQPALGMQPAHTPPPPPQQQPQETQNSVQSSTSSSADSIANLAHELSRTPAPMAAAEARAAAGTTGMQQLQFQQQRRGSRARAMPGDHPDVGAVPAGDAHEDGCEDSYDADAASMVMSRFGSRSAHSRRGSVRRGSMLVKALDGALAAAAAVNGGEMPSRRASIVVGLSASGSPTRRTSFLNPPTGGVGTASGKLPALALTGISQLIEAERPVSRHMDVRQQRRLQQRLTREENEKKEQRAVRLFDYIERCEREEKDAKRRLMQEYTHLQRLRIEARAEAIERMRTESEARRIETRHRLRRRRLDALHRPKYKPPPAAAATTAATARHRNAGFANPLGALGDSTSTLRSTESWATAATATAAATNAAAGGTAQSRMASVDIASSGGASRLSLLVGRRKPSSDPAGSSGGASAILSRFAGDAGAGTGAGGDAQTQASSDPSGGMALVPENDESASPLPGAGGQAHHTRAHDESSSGVAPTGRRTTNMSLSYASNNASTVLGLGGGGSYGGENTHYTADLLHSSLAASMIMTAATAAAAHKHRAGKLNNKGLFKSKAYREQANDVKMLREQYAHPHTLRRYTPQPRSRQGDHHDAVEGDAGGKAGSGPSGTRASTGGDLGAGGSSEGTLNEAVDGGVAVAGVPSTTSRTGTTTTATTTTTRTQRTFANEVEFAAFKLKYNRSYSPTGPRAATAADCEQVQKRTHARLDEKLKMKQTISKHREKIKLMAAGVPNQHGIISAISRDYEAGFVHGRTERDPAWAPPPEAPYDAEAAAAQPPPLGIYGPRMSFAVKSRGGGLLAAMGGGGGGGASLPLGESMSHAPMPGEVTQMPMLRARIASVFSADAALKVIQSKVVATQQQALQQHQQQHQQQQQQSQQPQPQDQPQDPKGGRPPLPRLITNLTMVTSPETPVSAGVERLSALPGGEGDGGTGGGGGRTSTAGGRLSTLRIPAPNDSSSRRSSLSVPMTPTRGDSSGLLDMEMLEEQRCAEERIQTMVMAGLVSSRRGSMYRASLVVRGPTMHAEPADGSAHSLDEVHSHQHQQSQQQQHGRRSVASRRSRTSTLGGITESQRDEDSIEHSESEVAAAVAGTHVGRSDSAASDVSERHGLQRRTSRSRMARRPSVGPPLSPIPPETPTSAAPGGRDGDAGMQRRDSIRSAGSAASADGFSVLGPQIALRVIDDSDEALSGSRSPVPGTAASRRAGGVHSDQASIGGDSEHSDAGSFTESAASGADDDQGDDDAPGEGDAGGGSWPEAPTGNPALPSWWRAHVGHAPAARTGPDARRAARPDEVSRPHMPWSHLNMSSVAEFGKTVIPTKFVEAGRIAGNSAEMAASGADAGDGCGAAPLPAAATAAEAAAGSAQPHATRRGPRGRVGALRVSERPLDADAGLGAARRQREAAVLGRRGLVLQSMRFWSTGAGEAVAAADADAMRAGQGGVLRVRG